MRIHDRVVLQKIVSAVSNVIHLQDIVLGQRLLQLKVPFDVHGVPKLAHDCAVGRCAEAVTRGCTKTCVRCAIREAIPQSSVRCLGDVVARCLIAADGNNVYGCGRGTVVPNCKGIHVRRVKNIAVD